MLIELLVIAYPDLSGRLTTTGEVTVSYFFRILTQPGESRFNNVRINFFDVFRFA